MDGDLVWKLKERIMFTSDLHLYREKTLACKCIMAVPLFTYMKHWWELMF